jgi:hypothetical protein
MWFWYMVHSDYPYQVKRHLRGALKGIKDSKDADFVEFEFIKALEECNKSNMDISSDPVLGIYEHLGEFYMHHDITEGIDTLAFVLFTLVHDRNDEKSLKRSVALSGRIGDLLLEEGHSTAASAMYEWTVKKLVGIQEPVSVPLNQLKAVMKDTVNIETLKWLPPDTFETSQYQMQNHQFKPVEWASVDMLVNATERLASVTKQFDVSTALYLNCIKLYYNEYTLKNKNVSKTQHSKIAVVCNNMASRFLEVGHFDAATYWINEAIEHSRLAKEKQELILYFKNKGHVLEVPLIYVLTIQTAGNKKEALEAYLEAKKVN